MGVGMRAVIALMTDASGSTVPLYGWGPAPMSAHVGEIALMNACRFEVIDP